MFGFSAPAVNFIIRLQEALEMNTQALVDILLDFSGDKIINYCEEELEKGTSPYEIFDNLSIGLDEIGSRYEKGRFFTSDLIVSGSNMKKAIERLRTLFKKEATSVKGRVLIGTVQGDVHDIGKTILSIMLQSKGFEVIDLGVDVSNETFLVEIEKSRPDILAMSALLSSTLHNMGIVIKMLKERGLRKDIKIIVGGAPVNREFAKKVGADEYGKDAVEGVRKCFALLNQV
jgi:5-methyltetrahydrofolate--homocysteine methyltransferase